MAQKPLREATAKMLIAAHYAGRAGAPERAGSVRAGEPVIRFAEVHPGTDLPALPERHAWLQTGKLVVKADELFGKRMKLGYVAICRSWDEATAWISERRGKSATIGVRTGTLDHFIVEPFVEHSVEYYLAFAAERERDAILFSARGGVDVEGGGTEPLRIRVKLGDEPDVRALPREIQRTALRLFQLWRALDLAFLEINPLTVADGEVHLLDAVCRVDDCAAFRQIATWGSLPLPDGFGSVPTAEERAIRALDARTGASLKFVLLNPGGHIWTMVAGGGASIIYADAATELADPRELANYGEWSGNPSADEMEAYAGNILALMTRSAASGHASRPPKALVIGGGIANFTDIAQAFAGVIRALRTHRDGLRNVKLFVRRAGPNDRAGLKALQAACDELGIACVTHGAELPMTVIVETAVRELNLHR